MAHRPQRRENAEEWLRWHEDMARTHSLTQSLLVAHHREEAARYRKMLATDTIPVEGLNLAPGFAATA